MHLPSANWAPSSYRNPPTPPLFFVEKYKTLGHKEAGMATMEKDYNFKLENYINTGPTFQVDCSDFLESVHSL